MIAQNLADEENCLRGPPFGASSSLPSSNHQPSSRSRVDPVISHGYRCSHAADAARHGDPNVPIHPTLASILAIHRAFDVCVLRNLSLTTPVASRNLDGRWHEENCGEDVRFPGARRPDART